MSESFAELLEESFANQKIKPGAILTGTVVGVNQDVVIVNAGLKSEAVISADQFFNERGELDVKVGDTVEVALDTVEDGFGETRLSREKAKRTRTWTRLEEAFQKGEIVKGMISGRVRGGFTVDRARSSTCARSAIPPRSRVRRSSSRSSSSTRSATTWSCRGALWSRPSTAQSASRC